MIATINGITIAATAAVMIIYRQQFGVEYTDDMRAAASEQAAYLVGYRLLWSMAKAYDRDIISPDSWILSLGDDDLPAAVEAAAELMQRSMGAYARSNGEDKDDNGNGESGGSKRFAATALRCGLRPCDLNDMTIEFALDCISEYIDICSGGASAAEQPTEREANEGDIAAFLRMMGAG